MARMSRKIAAERKVSKVSKKMAEFLHADLEDILGDDLLELLGDQKETSEEFETVNSAVVDNTVEETAKKLRESLDKKKKTDGEDDFLIRTEATLLYFSLKGQGFTKQICPECGREFAYKYKIGNFKMKCSNSCRRTALAKIGIEMNLFKTPEERWVGPESTQGVIPLIVPPDMYEAVKAKLQESGELPEEIRIPAPSPEVP
jgi:hypothetical protein